MTEQAKFLRFVLLVLLTLGNSVSWANCLITNSLSHIL